MRGEESVIGGWTRATRGIDNADGAGETRAAASAPLNLAPAGSISRTSTTRAAAIATGAPVAVRHAMKKPRITLANVDKLQKAADSELAAIVKEARKAEIAWPENWEAMTAEEIRAEIARRVKSHKLVPPFYQHVDGTSFSAPIVCSVVAQMLSRFWHSS